MLELLLVLLLAIHLLLMNVAAMAPLFALLLEWRASRTGQSDLAGMGKSLAGWSIVATMLGTMLGLFVVGVLWFLDQQEFFSGLAVVPRRRLLFGIAELAVFVGFMAIYWAGWGRMPRWAHRLFGWLAWLNVVYHFPVLFASVAVLSTRPEVWGDELGYKAFLQVMAEPAALARTVHFLLASIAVTGGLQMLLAQRRLRQLGNEVSDNEEPDSAEVSLLRRLVVWGARWGLAASLVQGGVGLWVLLALPAASQDALLGGDWLGTGLFGTAIFAMLGLLHHLLAVGMGDLEPGATRRAVGLLVLVVVLMVGARQRGRQEAFAANDRHAARPTPAQLSNL